MPDAIPAGAAAQLPPARMIDPRGHRFGAGVSAHPARRRVRDGDALARRARPALDRVSAAFGLRYSIYGVDLATHRGRGAPAARSSPSTSTRRASPRCSAAWR